MNKSFFEKIQTLHSSFISSVIMIAVTLVTFGIAFIPKPSSGLLAKNFMEGQAKFGCQRTGKDQVAVGLLAAQAVVQMGGVQHQAQLSAPRRQSAMVE